MADQQDVVVVAGEALGLVVHLGDQRAGGVDGAQVARGGRRRGPSEPRRGRRTPRWRPRAPRRSRRRTRRPPWPRLHDVPLCTISWRTYTGAPCFSSARSTVSTARSTPAQYPRGSASSTRLPVTPPVTELEAPGIPMSIVGGMLPRVLTPRANRAPAVGCGGHGNCTVWGPSAGRRGGDRHRGNPQASADHPDVPDDHGQSDRAPRDEDAAGRCRPGDQGDETLEALFPPKDEQPEWATFDEDLADGDVGHAAADGERLTEGRFALFTGGEPKRQRASLPPATADVGRARPTIVEELDYDRSPWPSCAPGCRRCGSPISRRCWPTRTPPRRAHRSRRCWPTGSPARPRSDRHRPSVTPSG